MRSTTTKIDADALAAGLRGELIRQGDPGYDDARAIYNAAIDLRPALIARCRDAADVVEAVRYARTQGVPLSVRGGGHAGPGLALVEGGLVIDLSRMDGVRVDPAARTVRVEGGATWGDVDHATQAFGLAVPSGILSTTGVGGLTLGGGHGYLSRRHGLTVDNLIEADVVLADGRLVKASASENPDLFWALRGGGGNFGVATSFEFAAHPVGHVHVGTVYGGPMFWPADAAGDVLRWYRDALPSVGRDVYGWFGFHVVPPMPPFPEAIHGERVCVISWCFTGSRDQAQAMLERARDVAEPLLDAVGQIPYAALQAMFDPIYPSGLQWHWKGDFVRAIPDEAVEQHLRFGTNLPTPHSTMHLYPIDGAVHDVASDATAFATRDAGWSSVFAGVDPDPANLGAVRTWAREYWQALHPHSAGGGYVNFLMEEGQDRIRATYGANYDRLAEVKARYDPDNLFRRNQNIPPSPKV